MVASSGTGGGCLHPRVRERRAQTSRSRRRPRFALLGPRSGRGKCQHMRAGLDGIPDVGGLHIRATRSAKVVPAARCARRPVTPRRATPLPALCPPGGHSPAGRSTLEPTSCPVPTRRAMVAPQVHLTPERAVRRPGVAAKAHRMGVWQGDPHLPPSGSPPGRRPFTRSEHGTADPGGPQPSGRLATLRQGAWPPSSGAVGAWIPS